MKKWILGVALLIVAITVFYNITGGNDPDEYREEIMKDRADTDRFMRFSDDSPFKKTDVPFDSLNYFQPSLDYKITARFIPVEKRVTRSLATNEGTKEDYLTYGYATFELHNQPQKLLILENVEDDKLFVPFGDLTSANETYGGGRYLDVEHNGSGSITLDFNKAYNPYCAYGGDYTCPLPPKENLMDVAVRAGERVYAINN